MSDPCRRYENKETALLLYFTVELVNSIIKSIISMIEEYSMKKNVGSNGSSILQ